MMISWARNSPKEDRRRSAALYDKYALRLYHNVRALLDNSHDAEDVVQAVFVEAWFAARSASAAKVTNWQAYLLTALRHEVARLAARRRQHHRDCQSHLAKSI